MENFTPDLIVTDWLMQPMDGIEFVKTVRGSRLCDPFVPVVMMSSQARGDVVATARDAGANASLAKPITAMSLFNQIRTLVDAPCVFVRCKSYIGPDRRRSPAPYKGLDRRGDALAASSHAYRAMG